MKSPSEYPASLPSDELICLPFLDIDTRRDLLVADAELARRGYPRWLIRSLRGVALPGLWWQLFDWDWAAIGAFDVLFGYSFIFVAAAGGILALGAYSWALLTFLCALLLLAAAVLGWIHRWRAKRETGHP